MISHKYFSDLISYPRAKQACSCLDPELRRALHLVQCSNDAVLKVLISFEPKALHFHFALGPAIMWKALTPAIQASSCLQTGLTHSHSCPRSCPVAAPSFFWESSLVRGLLGCFLLLSLPSRGAFSDYHVFSVTSPQTPEHSFRVCVSAQCYAVDLLECNWFLPL